MEIEIIKASGKALCRGDNCTRNPLYFNPDTDRIKKGTTCAAITVPGGSKGSLTVFYCRDCIDKLYQDVRMTLNSKLWVFQ